MKAQVLHKYDPEMKEQTWVTNKEMPDPKIEKASDVIVKLELSYILSPSSEKTIKFREFKGVQLIERCSEN